MGYSSEHPFSKAFGRSLGAVFLLKKVQGLPDIHGKSAEVWFAEQSSRSIDYLTKRLPTNYLEDFADRVCDKFVTWVHKDLVDEGMSNWLVRFVLQNGWHHMEEGVQLHRALAYVRFGVRNETLNLQKKQASIHRHEAEPLEEALDEKDPHALRWVLDRERGWDSPSVRRLLEQEVHPDAPLFLDLLMEGYNVVEIVGDSASKRPSMLPRLQQKPMTVFNWHKTYIPRIINVLREV